jgi:hypothetical protein
MIGYGQQGKEKGGAFGKRRRDTPTQPGEEWSPTGHDKRS